MEDSTKILGLSKETFSTVMGSALTVVSIFLVVTIGYYIYHYIFEKKK